MCKTDKVLVSVFLFFFLAMSGYIINSGNNIGNIYVVRDTEETNIETVEVTLSGSVKNPGTYSIEAGSDVYDAVAASGGPTRNADLKSVNMDKIITSSIHIDIPETVADTVEAGRTYPKVSIYNINTASEKQLTGINGIGDIIAGRIVEYRNANGPFKTTEEIKKVKGIGESAYEKIKEYITVEGE